MHSFKRIIALLIVIIPACIFAQEEIKSDVEEYYDFLSLSGVVTRPYLNYRTLSDSVWQLDKDTAHLWQGVNLAGRHRITDYLSYTVFAPKLFLSFNSAAPYGKNDRALWQGRGINLDIIGGARFECYGLELTLKPEFAFSHNMPFAYRKSIYQDTRFTGKAERYGYYGIPHIDAPQRFGNKPFVTYDWGDSELRYSYKTFTVGFGTQHIWLGPAKINPILHSNNAPSYPKFDIGMRKQPVILGAWNAGFMEFRTWWGMLQESKYFDNNSANDKNLITGLTFSYSPSFIPGFTVGLNRVMLSKWADKDWKSIFTLLIPLMQTSAGDDVRDQRASITFEYVFPKVGLDIYLEWAKNDYSPSVKHILRYPFHTQAYTLGIKKQFSVINNLKGEFLFEHTNVEASKDYLSFITWSTTLYAHHKILQGHTNKGQWLGAGIGTGGNSQYIGFKLYYPQGSSALFFQRVNPDNDFTWFIQGPKSKKSDSGSTAENSIRADYSIGAKTLYYITKDLYISGKFVFIYEFNPTNMHTAISHRLNTSTALSVQYVY